MAVLAGLGYDGQAPCCPLAPGFLSCRAVTGVIWGHNKGSKSPLVEQIKEETQDGGREMKQETVNWDGEWEEAVDAWVTTYIHIRRQTSSLTRLRGHLTAWCSGHTCPEESTSSNNSNILNERRSL